MARALKIEVEVGDEIKGDGTTYAWWRLMGGNGQTISTSEMFEVHSKAKSDSAKLHDAEKAAIQQARTMAGRMAIVPEIYVERDGEWVTLANR